jgi:hypothetical protein
MMIMDGLAPRDNLRPFAWFDRENLATSTWLTKWAEHCIQTKWAKLTIQKCRENVNLLYKTLCIDDSRVFVCPEDPVGHFRSAVLNECELNQFLEHKASYLPETVTELIVARPVKIPEEWRTIIHRGRIVAWSLHRLNTFKVNPWLGTLPQEVRAFARQVANLSWQPHPLYVLDVAVTSDGPKVVKAKSINTARLRGCAISPIVEAVIDEATRS